MQLANIRIAQLLDELAELREHSSAPHEAELRAQISSLRESLNASSLTEEELKALDRFHRGQRFKRSSEQTRLLKNRKKVSRSEEKDDFDGNGSSLSSQVYPAEVVHHQEKTKTGKRT